MRVFTIFLLFLLLTSFHTPSPPLSSYDIKEIHEAVELENGVKVLTQRGNLEDANLLLVPTDIEIGVYEVRVTRKAQDLYKLEGTNLYIETRYCYEYAFSEDAIMKLESNYGYTKGSLIFD